MPSQEGFNQLLPLGPRRCRTDLALPEGVERESGATHHDDSTGWRWRPASRYSHPGELAYANPPQFHPFDRDGHHIDNLAD